MNETKIQEVLDVLKKVIDPELKRDIVSLGMISDVRVCEGTVSFKFTLTTPACPLRDSLKKMAEDAVKSLPWVENVNITMSANVKGFFQKEPEKRVKGVKNIIAVVSGKGGVGKSTVALNLAYAFKKLNAKSALLDGDVYGPTLSVMGKTEAPLLVNEEEKLVPPLYYGIPIVSLGFMTSREQAIVWRGPLVHSAYKQLLFDVEWGEVDYLIVDLPPGTGDPLISITQLVELQGAVLVTTPQEVSIADVQRAGSFLNRMNVPIITIVENMKYVVCNNCSCKIDLFKGEGGKKLAELFKVENIIELPFDPELTQACERGEPFLKISEDKEISKKFVELAEKVASFLSIRANT